MARLKAGTVRNLQTDTLAGAMDAEFVSLWASLKDTDLPNDTRSKEDRRLMFVAIARGMLKYLHDHRADIETTDEQAGGSGTTHDHQLEFDWE
jgi:hypothetical protein